MTERKTIWQLRQERGWSQDDLAMRLGVSQSSIAAWERGRRQPRPHHLLRLAALCGVSVEEIVGGEGGAVRRSPTRRRPTTLRRLREERGWAQLDVAVPLGASVATISNWEQGRTRPHRVNRQRLADLFGVSVEQIAFGRVERP